jgi:hypothetical protein
MTQQQLAASASAGRLNRLRGMQRWWIVAGAALAALVIVGLVTSPLTAGATMHDTGDRVTGAGTTIIEGGTGGATPSPVTTLLPFHARAQGETLNAWLSRQRRRRDRVAVSSRSMPCM